MYIYDEIDQKLVDERVAQFRDQTRRFLAGKLSDDEFRALRLRNGLYIQRYAPMLRVAIPYGLLSTKQLRKLAQIARKYDRGYGHFSTRQNFQLNWPKLEQVPDILAELATVQMHAIQTSGNSFRNITTDHFAGVARDEHVDSFVWCELIRQWSTFHPEFSFLPRKFKIAFNGASADRAAGFTRVRYEALRDRPLAGERAFLAWAKRSVHAHKVPGYAAVTLSLKKTGVPTGDVTSDQMEGIADLADRYSFGELRVSHEQNLVLADVRQDELVALWHEVRLLRLDTPNLGLLTNIISCPGGDFCALANAKTIPVAEAIQRKFDDLDYLHDIGDLDLNISGCMNACGHHHVGHIGILGVDKNGEEWYQIEIGGNQGEVRPGGPKAALGKVIGPSFARAQVPDVIERLIECYLNHRDSDAERFIDVVKRIGIAPFKEYVYGSVDQAATRRHRELAAA